jgi:putative transposase
MSRLPYDTDLTDAQWELVEPFIPPEKAGGRPRSVPTREVLNAILYRRRTGCSWRMLPHEFPPWGTVSFYERLWRTSGVLSRIADTLHLEERRQRVNARTSEPRTRVRGSAMLR